MATWIYAVWAFAAGVLIPVMATLSGSLGRVLGSGEWAAVVVFGVAFAACLAFALIGQHTPPFAALRNARPEQLASGLIVAFYVISATYLTPRFGVAPTVLCVVVAQIVTAALIGQFGWFGAPRQTIDLVRAGGLCLMVVGLLTFQLRRA